MVYAAPILVLFALAESGDDFQRRARSGSSTVGSSNHRLQPAR
jgi:hypothetical protein